MAGNSAGCFGKTQDLMLPWYFGWSMEPKPVGAVSLGVVGGRVQMSSTPQPWPLPCLL